MLFKTRLQRHLMRIYAFGFDEPGIERFERRDVVSRQDDNYLHMGMRHNVIWNGRGEFSG